MLNWSTVSVGVGVLRPASLSVGTNVGMLVENFLRAPHTRRAHDALQMVVGCGPYMGYGVLMKVKLFYRPYGI